MHCGQRRFRGGLQVGEAGPAPGGKSERQLQIRQRGQVIDFSLAYGGSAGFEFLHPKCGQGGRDGRGIASCRVLLLPTFTWA